MNIRTCASRAIAMWFLTLIPAFANAAESTTGTILGTVANDAGVPLAGVTVAAAAPSGRATTTSDARGAFALLGLAPDTYVVSVSAPGYAAGVDRVSVVADGTQRLRFALRAALKTIGHTAVTSGPFALGDTSDSYAVTGDAARALAPAASSSGLGAYTQAGVQGAIVSVPGVDLDAFSNAILRGNKVSDAVFDYDSIPIPQGLIAEPGGNVDGAQLPTTGVGATNVTLAGYTNEGDNALGGVIDQIAATGTYPDRTDVEIADGAGTRLQEFDARYLGATPDLKLRYAVATRSASQYFTYGDPNDFYPEEAATYGLALQDSGEYSLESNVHYRATSHDDVSVLIVGGQEKNDQYGSPYPGETIGALDERNPNGTVAFGYPGYTNQNEPVDFASGIKGSFDAFKLEWAHTGSSIYTRVQAYDSEFGSSAGGPFWDENGFPDGAISLMETSAQRQDGFNVDNDGIFGRNHLRFGVEYRVNTSSLEQVVPTAQEYITSQPAVQSYLAYFGDRYAVSDRLELSGTARVTGAHFKPSYGTAYDTGALDPHVAASYRLGSEFALRATFDHTTVAPAPLEADRVDSTNTTPAGALAPFVPLDPEAGNEFTYSFETRGPVALRATYYQEFEKNLIDVLPFNFRSALSSGLDPDGIGVPTNVGGLRADGFELSAKSGRLTFDANLVRAFSSSASQFAYNDLNAPAVAAGHLFPVNYEPDLVTTLAYEFRVADRHLRIAPSLSYESGYPYGNGKDVYIFDPATNKPELVPNDNYVNPGYNYYFLANPANPYNARTNPYIGNLGTNEGSDPDTLRSNPQLLANLHAEVDVAKGTTLVLDVANMFGEFAPTAYQGNPYLIGPPGYAGGNPLYQSAVFAAAGYGCPIAGNPKCLYTLGNGVPTNNGSQPIVPFSYGRGGYVPQSWPLGRTIQLRLRFRV